jgi:pyruvate/2-oxoacid:ferredoxin oxidoreductase alpha subunit
VAVCPKQVLEISTLINGSGYFPAYQARPDDCVFCAMCCLMSEGLSYIAAAQCPAVFVNIMRGGPGLGGILPSQADYLQATKGIGHGDFRLLVLAPASVQEAVEMVMTAFPLAEKYRNPVMTPVEAVQWAEETMLPYYRLGDVKTPEP